jgi:zinc transport system substrate-binding protein
MSILIPGVPVSAEPLQVYTVNYPLQYFAERIAGEQARVVFPAPAGSDPATWQPGISEIHAYQQADLVVLNGAGYAQWVQQASLPRARLLDTSAAFSDALIEIGDSATHSHGPGGEHAHTGYAATTWLDPVQAVSQASAIRDVLVKLRPDAGAALEQNFKALKQDLLELDSRLQQVTAELQSVPILVAHPVYQYLGRRYALDIHSAHREDGRYPELAELAGKEQPLIMLRESAAPPATQQQLEKQGIRPVVFATAAKRPVEGDYFTVMEENLARLDAVTP